MARNRMKVGLAGVLVFLMGATAGRTTLLGEGLHLLRPAHVGDDGQHLHAGLLQPLGRVVQRGALHVGEHHAHALLAQLEAHRPFAEAIAAAVDQVTETVGEEGLYALINNAGIVIPGPLKYTPLEEFRQHFEVNLFGLLDVTQQFLPLLGGELDSLERIRQVIVDLIVRFAKENPRWSILTRNATIKA